MRVEVDDGDQRTIWCGNLSDQVTDEILYELFLQAGPLESVRRPRDPNGRPKSFAFIVYKHDSSVPYALELFRGEKLFNRALNLNSRSRLHHIPVLDTHLTEFNEYTENNYQSRNESREIRSDRKYSERERDSKEPKSWAELNALRGKGSLLNGHLTSKREDLQGPSMRYKESKSENGPVGLPDFNTLLQMGQQMMAPGMLAFSGLSLPGSILRPMVPVGLGHIGGANMYPSMQEGLSGGKHNSPERNRRSEFHERRGSTRDHPYQDRRQNDHYNDHRRHDRGYSSSRSLHERERRDRRSR